MWNSINFSWIAVKDFADTKRNILSSYLKLVLNIELAFMKNLKILVVYLWIVYFFINTYKHWEFVIKKCTRIVEPYTRNQQQ